MADPFGLQEVQRALAEDRARDDVTTGLLGALAQEPGEARFVAEGRFVAAGLPLLATVFRELDSRAAVTGHTPEGCAATLTRRAVDAVRHTSARITHTRKTTPGLRGLELYAVTIGGGVENRASLAAAVLWKDNHWALLGRNGHTLPEVLRDAPPDMPVIVEVESDAQLEAALAAGVTHILVDNQRPEQLAAWARRAGPAVTIQASGGISVDTARDYAQAGASLIAIGALTHSAPAAPISCEIRGIASPPTS